MSLTLIALLRILHIVSGGFWMGVMILNAGFLLPAVQASGPAGGQVMKQLVQTRRLPLFLNLAVVVTLISGGILFWWVSGSLSSEWLSSRFGLSLTIGGILAIVAALMGYFINAPTARRFGQLAAQSAGTAPTPDVLSEMGRLQKRLLRATQIAAILLLLAAATMAVGRYLH